MRIRYCRTEKGKIFPCSVGWCSIRYDNNNLAETKDCSDAPMEKNCNNIVEIDDEERQLSLFN